MQQNLLLNFMVCNLHNNLSRTRDSSFRAHFLSHHVAHYCSAIIYYEEFHHTPFHAKLDFDDFACHKTEESKLTSHADGFFWIFIYFSISDIILCDSITIWENIVKEEWLLSVYRCRSIKMRVLANRENLVQELPCTMNLYFF